MRAIDGDALWLDLMMLPHNGDIISSEDVERIILEAPTLDYKDLVPQGEWVYHECVSSHDGTTSGYSCSNCCGFVDEDVFDTDEFHKAFCGNCGARMTK